MTSNYEEITRQNVFDRGEKFDDIGAFLSEQFYSDQTHFVYELLQNAQDALKRRMTLSDKNSPNRSIEFNLTNNALELRHFGATFNTEDVKAITNILHGTKTGEDFQIGRFGIGFKSVYAFTDSPMIYSGSEHFCIERYIRPKAISPVELRDDETLFVFPFNNPKKESQDCFTKIHSRLTDLGLRTLLFLDEIDTIEWSVNREKKGTFLRQSIENIDGSYVITLLGQQGIEVVEEKWLVFRRWIADVKSSVEIAFLLMTDKKSGRDLIQPIERSHLFAYFETARETRLHFLIQGHYFTTPPRDNILEDNLVNKLLIRETSILFAETLEKINAKGLLDAQLLEAMPIVREQFTENSFFYPIYESFLKSIKHNPLLPTSSNKSASASNVKLARGAGLIQLLDSTCLQELFNTSDNIEWLNTDITADRTPNLRRFLINVLNVDEIDAEKFGRLISDSFLRSRTDKWFIKFYEFLLTNPSLWKKREYRWEEEGVLRNKPIIRLENNNLAKPYEYSLVPTVYLPPDYETDYPIVKKEIAKDSNAIKFLINLGLQTPDIVDEVVTRILSFYPSRSNDDIPERISDEDHQIHIKKIRDALSLATGEKKKWLLRELQSKRLLRALNQGTALRIYKSPIEIYIDDKELRDYFEGNPGVYFYDPIYLMDLDLLEDIGVSRHIRMKNRNEKCEYIDLPWEDGHRRGINGFNPKWEVDGLMYAISNPNINRSKIIWETILRPNKHLIYGTVESCTRQTYLGSTKKDTTSLAGKIVRQGKWLPDRYGGFHTPEELSLDDLPDDFYRDDELATQLGMKIVSVKTFATARGIHEEDLRLAIDWISTDCELFRKLAPKALVKKEDEFENSNFDYHTSLNESFEKKFIENEVDDLEEEPFGEVLDPEKRRAKTHEDLLLAYMNMEQSSQRFRRISAIVWDKKDKASRFFLIEEYKGKCQICNSSFQKRNHLPYFEGLYLVSHTKADWIDRPGNILCLCANCCAKLLYGPVELDDFIGQVMRLKLKNEGGNGNLFVSLKLCGEDHKIRYSEKHLLDLQELIKVSQTPLEE